MRLCTAGSADCLTCDNFCSQQLALFDCLDSIMKPALLALSATSVLIALVALSELVWALGIWGSAGAFAAVLGRSEPPLSAPVWAWATCCLLASAASVSFIRAYRRCKSA